MEKIYENKIAAEKAMQELSEKISSLCSDYSAFETVDDSCLDITLVCKYYDKDGKIVEYWH